MIKIELNEKDARLFVLFRKYQDDFLIMSNHHLFDFKDGKAVIHRDNLGKLRKIEIDKIEYKL